MSRALWDSALLPQAPPRPRRGRGAGLALHSRAAPLAPAPAPLVVRGHAPRRRLAGASRAQGGVFISQAPHTPPTGSRPVFFARIGLAHQAFDLGLYDLLPGSIQGRIPSFGAIEFQNRGGSDGMRLDIVDAPFAALGKALRLAGKSSGSNHDGSSVELRVLTGTPWAVSADRAGMLLVKPWKVAEIPSAGAVLWTQDKSHRLTLFATGTITCEFWDDTAGAWVTVTDAAAFSQGDLVALSVSWDNDGGRGTYRRTSDRAAEFFEATVTAEPGPLTGTAPQWINGDGAGALAYCPSVDVDDFRWWTRQLTQAQHKAAARRTLIPSEAFDSSLSAWFTFDAGDGANQTNQSPLDDAGDVIAVMTSDSSSGLFSVAPEPAAISGITRDRFTDQIEGAYPVEGASVSVFVTFTDPITYTPQKLFEGFVREMPGGGREVVSLEVVDVSEKVHKELGTVIRAADFPRAPLGSIGKIAPIVFGAVSDLQGVHVGTAEKTSLRASVLAADVTIPVEDTDAFPSSGSIIIGEERISYTGKTGAPTPTFTGATRGTASTIPTSHVTGAQVIEFSGETFLMAGHALASISNVRKINSRGEAVPADSSEFTVALASPAGVVFTQTPRVPVLGTGSLWAMIDLEGASPFDNSLDAANACRLNAAWEETNFAMVDATSSLLSVERTSDYAGPAIAAGVLKAYIVFEHHRVSTLVAPARVAVELRIGNVPVLAPGDLTAQTNTPDRALEQGAWQSFSEGFESAHQHTMPGGLHTHTLGPGALSTVIRPLGANRTWAEPIAPITGTSTSFYLGVKSQAIDNNPDTAAVFTPTSFDHTFLFGNLRNTRRLIKKVRVVVIAAGGALFGPIELTIAGSIITTTNAPSGGTGLGNRETLLSPIVDVSAAVYRVADLLRPDSHIVVPPTFGLEVYELFLELDLDELEPPTNAIRPRYSNWPQPLPNLTGSSPVAFEPSVFPGNPTDSFGVLLTISPNTVKGGPALPFTNQVQPTWRHFFTEAENPFEILRRAIVKIAHSNVDLGGASDQQLQADPSAGSSAPALPIAPASGTFRPRYSVALVIKGVTVSTWDLDMSTAPNPVAYPTSAFQPGTGGLQPRGIYTQWVDSQSAYGQNGLALLAPRFDCARVESTSGWIDLTGLAPGGGDFKANDLVGPTSYIEITLPPPTLDLLEPNLLDASYRYWHVRSQKFFNIELEYYAEGTEDSAQLEDIGPTAVAQALSHSSLTWYDITSLWLLVNDWNALKGVEFAAIATSFLSTDFVRILTAHAAIEFGFVELETTTKVLADVDSGDGGNPIDHVARIFDDYLGAGYKDGGAFARAEAQVRTDAAGVVTELVDSRVLIDSILLQYSCSGHWEAGKFSPLFKPALASIAAGSPVLTANDVARDSARLRHTPPDEIVNEVEVLYGVDTLSGGFTDSVIVSSSASKAAYGFTKRRIIEADWIQTAAAATALANNVLDYGDHVQAVVEVTVYLPHLALSRGDVVGLSHPWGTRAALEILEQEIDPGGGERPPSMRLVTVDRGERPS